MFFFTIFSIGTTGSSILFVQEKNYAYRVYKSVYFVSKISNFVEVIIKCMRTSHEHRINATIITWISIYRVVWKSCIFKVNGIGN